MVSETQEEFKWSQVYLIVSGSVVLLSTIAMADGAACIIVMVRSVGASSSG